MAKCGTCGKFVAAADVVKCDKCCATYHRSCAGSASKATEWHCVVCRKKAKETVTPEDRSHQPTTTESSPDEFLDTSPLNVAQRLTQEFKAELKTFKEDFIKTMTSELQMIRDEMVMLKSVLTSRMDDLEKRVVDLERKKEDIPAAGSNVDVVISQLKCELNDRDQELLGNDIEVVNLPETPNENPLHTAILIAAKIGVNIEARDIVSAERIGSRYINATEPATENTRTPRSRRLIVRLSRRDLRDELLRSARVRRGTTSADLELPGPPTRFYLNERLTKTNRQLFRMARDIGTERGWKYVWTKRGRILARYKPADPSYLIRCEADIQRVFGPNL